MPHTRRINAGGSRPEGFDTRRATKVGVLGVGMTGAGIAYAPRNDHGSIAPPELMCQPIRDSVR
jgi:hypothetical protein